LIRGLRRAQSTPTRGGQSAPHKAAFTRGRIIPICALLWLATSCGGAKGTGRTEKPADRSSVPETRRSSPERVSVQPVFRAEAHFLGTAGDSVESSVVVANRGSQRARLRVGPCTLRVRIHQTPSLSDIPLWDSERNRPSVDSEVCRVHERWLELLPGDSAAPSELRMRIPVLGLAAERKPSSSLDLYFTHVIHLDGDSVRAPVAMLSLPKSQHTLPIHTSQGLTFQAESRAIPDRYVLFTVTIGNTSRVPVEVLPDWCPVLIRAYRNPERSGRPAWDPSDVERWRAARKQRQADFGELCPNLPPIKLAPGASGSIPERVSMRRILGDSLQAGRYYFSVRLRLSRPSLTSLELGAGSAVLTR
jgi:hypothetical protein